MAPPRDALALELALDRLEAELATQLPGHIRAFARAHAAGLAPPPAPRAASRPSSVALAREALAHPALAARATALLRLVAPLAIDADPSVAPLRAASPSWPALAALAAARDQIARAWLGLPYVALHHTLHVGPLTAAPPVHPASERPVSVRPMSEQPGAVSPESGRPVSECPVPKRPVPKRPASECPASERPASERPMSECLVSERSGSERPVPERPASERPASERPPFERPVPERPASERSGSERSGSERPTSERPVSECPVSESPVSECPVSESPVSECPVSESPVSESPVSESPVSECPASERPVSECPASERPVSECPVSERPVSECPVSERPVSESPVSERPASESPVFEHSVVVPEHLASGAAASEGAASEGAVSEGAVSVAAVSGRFERTSAADADLRALRAAAKVEIPGWTDPGPPLGRAAIEARWRELARRHGARGAVHIVESAAARPRAFVVEPGREVILVVPANAGTPAARFAVLHELGHAVAALLEPGGLPRAVDEAVAAYVARDQEVPEDPAFSPLAAAARQRRTAIAQLLERVERALPAPIEIGSAAPPWALWHDAGAQAAYVAAEQLADRWWRELGARPGPGALARALAEARATVDGAAVDGAAVDGTALPRG